MNTIVKAGVVLGVLVELWTSVMCWTGWYKDPARLSLFWLVIPIEIGVLVWALRKTAAEGRGYGGQVGAGTSISLIGGIIIAAGSFVLTAIVFPDYFKDLAAIQQEMLHAAGRSEAEIKQMMDMTARTSTPAMQAIFGFAGTVMTGILSSLVIGAFARAKKAQAP